MWLSAAEAALAIAEASAGETDAGLRRLDDSLAELEATDSRWYEAEMHRIRAEILLKRPSDQFPYAFAHDGTLLYAEIGPTTGRDLWTLSPDGKTTPVLVTPFNEFAAQFSPEPGGPRWIAYASDESGRPDADLLQHADRGAIARRPERRPHRHRRTG